MKKSFVKQKFNKSLIGIVSLTHLKYEEPQNSKRASITPITILSNCSFSENYLSINGGNMRGPIDMGEKEKQAGFSITGLPDPSFPTDAVNLRFLKNNCIGPWGGMLVRNLYMGHIATVTGLPNPVNFSDAVNLQTLDDKLKLITSESLKALPLTGGSMLGLIDMNGFSIQGLSIPYTDREAVPLITLKKYAFPITGGELEGNISLRSKYRIRDLADPILDTDAVNLRTLQKAFMVDPSSFDDLFLSKTGGTISGDLNINGHLTINKELKLTTPLSLNLNPLSNLGTPVEENDALPFGFAKSQFLSYFGGILRGNLNLDNKWKIEGLAAPEYPSDAVNLDTLEKYIASIHCMVSSEDWNLMTLAGGTMQGSLNMNQIGTITGLPSPQDPSDAVPLAFLQKSYLSIHGGQIFGNLSMRGESTITGLPFPTNSKDALSLEYAEKNFLSLKGGSLSGDLDVSGHCITGVADPIHLMDAVNLQTLDLTIKIMANNLSYQLEAINKNILTVSRKLKRSTSFLSRRGGIMDGDISMNGAYHLNDLLDPESPSHPVTLNFLQRILRNYLPLQGVVHSASLDFGESGTITGIKDPIADTDAVNLRTLLTAYTSLYEENLYNESCHLHSVISAAIDNGSLVQADFLNIQLSSLSKEIATTYLPLEGGSLSGELDLGASETSPGFCIKGLADPVDDRDAVNKQTLVKAINALHLDETITFSTGGKMKGVLDMGANPLTGIPDPTKNTDAVNHQTLIRTTSTFLPKIGGVLKGPLSMNSNTISELGDPVKDTDAVNLKTLKESLVPLLTKINAKPEEPLDMNHHSIKGLSDPINDDEAVNLKTLKQSFNESFEKFIVRTGDTMSGPLNMANQSLTGLPLPVEGTDAITKNYLSTCGILEAYLIKPMTEVTSIIWQNSTKISWNRFGDDIEASKDAYNYFQIGGVNGSALMLYKEKLYTLNLSVLTETALAPGCKLSLYINRGLSSYKIGADNPESGNSFHINASWPINLKTPKGSDHFFLVYSGSYPLMTEGFYWSIFAYGIPL